MQAEKQALLCSIIYHNPCLSDDKLLSPKGLYYWLNVWCAYFSCLWYLKAEVLYVFCFLPALSLEILHMFLKWYFFTFILNPQRYSASFSSQLHYGIKLRLLSQWHRGQKSCIEYEAIFPKSKGLVIYSNVR